MIKLAPDCAQTFAQPCFGISQNEILFVLKFPGLNHKQKFVWLSLAILCNSNPDFSRQISLHTFAGLLKMSVMRVSRIIKQLEIMGFVQLDKSFDGGENVKKFLN